MPTSDPDCLFCKIISGEIPGDVVLRTDSVVAFRDVNPQAPTHILIVPTRHEPNAATTAAADPADAAALLSASDQVAHQEGIAETGYRLVFNTGAAAQQTVFHTHLHLLGGRAFTWPPG